MAKRQVVPVPGTPLLKVAILNDYPIVVLGLDTVLRQHDSRIQVIALEPEGLLPKEIDVLLWDAFAGRGRGVGVALEVGKDCAKIALFADDLTPEVVSTAMAAGVAAYVSKRSSPQELVTALEAIHAGHPVQSLPPGEAEILGLGDWPGRSSNLSSREAEIIAYIARGYSNAEIAGAMFLGVNTIKTYIRTAYRKIGVQRRSHATLWALGNGFTPDQRHFPNLGNPA